LHRKTRSFGLSASVVFEILHLAILVEHRLVTDGRTDRRTADTRRQQVPCYHIASRG